MFQLTKITIACLSLTYGLTTSAVAANTTADAKAGAVPSALAVKTAAYAVKSYQYEVVTSLARMVKFNTVADPTVAFESNPQHLGFKQLLQSEAKRLGFDYTDHGYVIVIGMGDSSERLGIITHGDVQPSNPAKWAKSPFELDTTSESGRLIGRGTEDDKGPIATALYAMKAIKDKKIALKKRLELYVYMAEESDWAPLEKFLKTHVPPQVNITLDAEYPVVTAEKGWGMLNLTVPKQSLVSVNGEASLSHFAGGFFSSQIPEDASATIANADAALEEKIRQRAATQKGMRYQYQWQQKNLTITALGVSAHSSKPEDGINAISMLADVLTVRSWENTTAGALVNFLNDMVGTGLYGEKFGHIAYRDSFMGPMTFAPTVIKQTDAGPILSINLRRPQGKSEAQLKTELNSALAQWQDGHVKLADISMEIGAPWLQTKAPQIDTLLSVFSFFTGIKDAKPMSIGGGTNSRLFPNAVSFGPSMPNTVYTGHTEHEFITRKQLLLNLKMYTAALVELAR
jgi:dipeptidase D